MPTTYDIPEMLDKNDPFGHLLLEFVSSKFKDEDGQEYGVEFEEVYPDKNYTETTIELKINGVEVHPKMFRAMFLEYAKKYAKAILRDAIRDKLSTTHNLVHDLEQTLRQVHRDIRNDFGLPVEEYEDQDRW